MESKIKQSIKDYGITRGRPYSESTIKIYLSNIRNLHHMCCGDKDFKDLIFLTDYEKVETVMGELKDHTRRNYLNALLVALHSETPKPDMLIAYYSGKRDVLNHKTAKDLGENGGLTSKQEDTFNKVSKENIDAFLSGINPIKIKHSHYELMMYLLMLIHRQYPLRNELGDCKFIKRSQMKSLSEEDKLKSNWCLLDASGKTGIFIITKYKTSKTYGTREIPIDASIMPIIRLWLKQRKIEVTSIKDDFTPPFCCFTNGNGMTRNALSHKFSDYTKQYLGAPISTTMMAKYYSVTLDLNSTMEDIKKAQHRADMRGHSLSTQVQNYQINK
jgi:hypothetical protein